MLSKCHAFCRPALWLAAALGGLCQSLVASDADLLRILEQKGYLSASEVRELTLSRELEAKAAAENAEGQKSALVITAPGNKNALELAISGRIQFQYDGLGAQVDTGGNSSSLPSSSTASFRRLFLGTSLKLRNDWYAFAHFNFAANGNTTGGLVDQVRVGWQPDRNLNLWLGHDKVPFGYDATTSSARLLTIENAPSTNFFARTLAFNMYHIGGAAMGKLDGGFDYQIMLANGGQGFTNSGGNGYSVWGRIQHTTVFEDSDAKLMVGADVGYQSENTSTAAWLRGASIFGYGAHARLDIADLMVVGEFLGASVEGVSGYDRSNPYSAMGMVAYTIDDIQPVFQYAYINSGGFAGGINPSDLMRNAPTNSLMGTAAGPDSIHTFYLGANYYIMGNDLRLSVGAIYATAPANDGFGGNNTSYEAFGGRAQLQVLF